MDGSRPSPATVLAKLILSLVRVAVLGVMYQFLVVHEFYISCDIVALYDHQFHHYHFDHYLSSD